jgi:hypothetical protein
MATVPAFTYLTLSEAVDRIMSRCGGDQETARQWLLRALAQGDLSAWGYTSRSHDRRRADIETTGWVTGRVDWTGNAIKYGSINVRKTFCGIEIDRRRLDLCFPPRGDTSESTPHKTPMPDLGLVPAGCIGIVDMLMAIIAQRHGDEWTRPIEVYQDVNSGELLIAGGPPETNTERFGGVFEDARETLLGALRGGRLEAYVDAGEIRHYTVSRMYWNMGAAYRTLQSGRLELDARENSPPIERLLDQKNCFVLQGQFQNWLSTIEPPTGGNAGSDESVTAESVPAVAYAPQPAGVVSDLAAALLSHMPLGWRDAKGREVIGILSELVRRWPNLRDLPNLEDLENGAHAILIKADKAGEWVAPRKFSLSKFKQIVQGDYSVSKARGIPGYAGFIEWAKQRPDVWNSLFVGRSRQTEPQQRKGRSSRVV